MAIKRVRKEKTIVAKWEILTNGVALSLAGRDLALQVQGPTFNKFIPFSIENGNVIVATIQGTDITETGRYRLVLWENKGKNGQTVVDTDAVQVVERSELESGQ